VGNLLIVILEVCDRDLSADFSGDDLLVELFDFLRGEVALKGPFLQPTIVPGHRPGLAGLEGEERCSPTEPRSNGLTGAAQVRPAKRGVGKRRNDVEHRCDRLGELRVALPMPVSSCLSRLFCSPPLTRSRLA
jgi:hypothetical protein